jgi:hypothetical protein
VAKEKLKDNEDTDVEEEDEEEEEEYHEEKDEDDQENVTADTDERHKLRVECDHLLGKSRGFVYSAAMRPITIDIEAIVRQELFALMDSVVDWSSEAKKQTNMIDLHKKDYLVQDLNMQVPVLPSPFTSAEGAAIWRNMLDPPSLEAVGKGKGGAKGKTEKKHDKHKGPSPEQLSAYYKFMFESVRQNFLDLAVEAYIKVDEAMHKEAHIRFSEQGLCGCVECSVNSPNISSSLFNVATVRKDDIISLPVLSNCGGRKLLVVSIDGSALYCHDDFVNSKVSEISKSSVFNEVKMCKERALTPVYEAAQSGALSIIVLYESRKQLRQSEASLFDYSMSKIANDVQLILDRLEVLARRRNRQYITLRKKQATAKTTGKKMEIDPFVEAFLRDESPDNSHVDLEFNVKGFSTIPELQAHLFYTNSKGQENNGNSKSKKAKNSSRMVEILVLEDLANPRIVPPNPQIPQLHEDDLDAPIDVGIEEFDQYRLRKWTIDELHEVSVSVVVQDETVDRNVSISCCTDPYNALVSLLLRSYNSATEDLATALLVNMVYVIADCSSFLSSSTCILQQLLKTVNEKRGKCLVSSDFYDSTFWSAVISTFPYAGQYYHKNESNGSERFQNEINETLNDNTNVSRFHLISNHLFNMISDSENFSDGYRPRFTVVIGGDIRIEKLRFLDEILDLADTIIFGGEFSLPFLAVSSRLQFIKYRSVCDLYREACHHLLKKAKLRGVKCVLPIDLVVGDESIEVYKRRAFLPSANTDDLGGDDGIDYDGVIRSVYIGDPLEKEAISRDNATLPTGENRNMALDALLGPMYRESEDTHFIGEKILAVKNFIYDVGESSIERMKQETNSSDLMLIWGTLGACEISGFQNGQKALVNATALEFTQASAAVKTPKVCVIGQSSVEWFARFNDKNGELCGDLVGGGRLAFMSRESSFFSGIWSLCRPKSFAHLAYRLPGSLREKHWSNRREHLKHIFDDDFSSDDDVDDNDDSEDES